MLRDVGPGGRMMVLVHRKTGKEAERGEKFSKGFGGAVFVLCGGMAPQREGSSGYVWVVGDGEPMEIKADGKQFPSLFDLEWANDG